MAIQVTVGNLKFNSQAKALAFFKAMLARYNDGETIDEIDYTQILRPYFRTNVRGTLATVQRWVVECSPELMEQGRKVMKSSADSWRMDETYIKVKGEWTYLYRAVDKFGNTIDFMLSKKRDKLAAMRFFARAIGHAGVPEKEAA